MPEAPKWFWTVLAIAAVLAAVWRVSEPYGGRLASSDELGYLAVATNLAAGRGFTEYHSEHTPPYQSERTAWRAPLFPALLSLFFLTGEDETAIARAKTGQALLGGAAVFLLGILGLQLHGDKWAALLGAALWLREPVSLDLAKLLITEPLFLTLMLASLVALAWSREKQSTASYAVSGVLIGLATLTRPVLYPFIAGLLLLFAWRARSLASRRRLAVFVLALVVMLAPWIARNTLVNERLTPLTTNGGFNLYLDNSGREHIDVWTELHERTLAGGVVNEAVQSVHYRRRAVDRIASHPGAFAAQVGDRLIRMGNSPRTMTLLAILGIVVVLRRRLHENLATLLALGGMICVYAVFLYDQRMAVTLTPFRFLYGSFAVVWLAREVAKRGRRLVTGEQIAKVCRTEHGEKSEH